MAGRWPGGARQRPDHLLRSQQPNHPHRAARPKISQRHLYCERRPIDPVRRNVWLLDQALLVRRPEHRENRGRAGEPAGLSRQYQSGVRRKLLAGDGRHAQPRARSCMENARLPQAHGQTGSDRRMAVPQHQHRMRHQVQRARRRAGLVVGPARRQPSDDHIDARTSRLSLSRRHRQQSYRPIQAGRCRPRLRPVRTALEKNDMISALKDFADRFLGRGDATITVPSFDGALKPNQILEKAETIGQFDAPEDLATDGKALYIADGSTVLRLDGTVTTEVRRFERTITALCCLSDGGMAAALDGREVRVFATPSASSPRATVSDPALNAINALSPGPQGTLSARDRSRWRRYRLCVCDLVPSGRTPIADRVAS